MVVAWHVDEAAAQAVAAEIAGVAVRVDVAVEADVVNLFAAARAHGDITAVVANAGIVAPATTVAELSGDRIRRLFETNVYGAMFTVREAIRHMSTVRGGQGGSVVCVGSVASRIGSSSEYVDYAASKAAIDTFVLGVSKEVAAEGIRVNGVRPGIIDTGIHASGGQPDRALRLAPLIPLARPGTADEAAAAIAWLLTDEASYVTGALLDVSGGR